MFLNMWLGWFELGKRFWTLSFSFLYKSITILPF
jgi:hypothetical protein